MYNKKDIMVFVENIHTLANLYGMKIGEVENKAGISKGYVSRLKKAGETANIQDDTVKKIADVFGCSTKAIMYHNLEDMGKDELYYFDFVLKLYDETKHDIIIWNFKETKDLITKEEYENHPYKFFYEHYYNSDDKDKCYCWSSKFLYFGPNGWFLPSYPFVWTSKIGKDTELMFIYFEAYDDDLKDYGKEGAFEGIAVELYLNKNGTIVPLCADYNDNALAELLYEFYFEINFRQENRPRLTDDIREIIDNYMGKEKEDA